MTNNNNEDTSIRNGATPFAQTYFHGTRADLKIGDLIQVGYNSNMAREKMLKCISG